MFRLSATKGKVLCATAITALEDFPAPKTDADFDNYLNSCCQVQLLAQIPPAKNALSYVRHCVFAFRGAKMWGSYEFLVPLRANSAVE